MIRFETGKDVPLDQLLSLYRTLGWLQHKYPDRVEAALAASTRVVTAWDGERLVGMARMITDGQFCMYLPEILLDPACQRQGYGRALMERLVDGYGHVRMTVLLADDGNEPFYGRFGFRRNTGEEGFQAMWRIGSNWDR